MTSNGELNPDHEYPSFGVHGVVASHSQIVVIGRCYTGTVKIGTVFNRIAQLMSNGDIDKNTVIEIDPFLVIEITAYRRTFDSLECGMTGQLTLAVDNPRLNIPKAGDVLYGI